MLSTITSCPVCSGTDFASFITCEDHTASHEKFAFQKCKSCKFVFTNPRPDEESIGKYYLSSNYISHTGGGNNLIDALYLFIRKIALRWKRQIIKRNSSGKNLLDYGCGTGEFLNEMRNNGWAIAGVEPSLIANKAATEITNQKIYSLLSETERQDYDIITLWHVIEHVHDLSGTLKQLNRLLVKTGTIFIAVPNLQSYDAQLYQSHWAAYDVPRHLWHFDKSSMKRLLENNGFRLVKVLPMKMDSFYVSMLSESYQHPHQSKIVNLIKGTFNGLKSNWTARKEVNYSSLIYIAKK